MTDIALTRTLSGLAPADDHAREILKRWPIGETLKADVRKPRALRTLKRWWVLCNLVSANSDQFKTPDMVHQYLKLRAGHCDQIIAQSTGEIYLIPSSISFDALDETEFQDVWRRAVDVVLQDILPGVSERDLEAEILRLCGLAGGGR